jgi:hypothetical protein
LGALSWRRTNATDNLVLVLFHKVNLEVHTNAIEEGCASDGDHAVLPFVADAADCARRPSGCAFPIEQDGDCGNAQPSKRASRAGTTKRELRETVRSPSLRRCSLFWEQLARRIADAELDDEPRWDEEPELLA